MDKECEISLMALYMQMELLSEHILDNNDKYQKRIIRQLEIILDLIEEEIDV